MTAPAQTMTTAELMRRLERHYIPPQDLPGGIFVPECGINGATGPRCDAVYVGFTSASGRILVGHEVKASRADWRRELDKPGKADPWHDQCHAWYLVAPSTDVVPVEEVPAGWGLMVPNTRTKTRMTLVVKADVKRDHRPSWTAVRSIMARQDTLRAQAVAVVKRDAEAKARERLTAEANRHAVRADPELERALDVVRQIERGTGLALLNRREDGAYASFADVASPDQFKAALRIVKAADGVRGGYDGILATARRLEEARERLADAAAEVDRLTAGGALAQDVF